ncbi:MAG TPA: flagellar basal body L-ring protein FlgH, partial [Burkholderiaceae bacterium]|nr:flagellar basal body L-ring protein FlgH [Burkholderiaceae bacterium]
MNRLTALALVLAGIALAGCDTMSEALNKRPPVDVLKTEAVRPQPVVETRVNNGSIFQAGQY